MKKLRSTFLHRFTSNKYLQVALVIVFLLAVGCLVVGIWSRFRGESDDNKNTTPMKQNIMENKKLITASFSRLESFDDIKITNNINVPASGIKDSIDIIVKQSDDISDHNDSQHNPDKECTIPITL